MGHIDAFQFFYLVLPLLRGTFAGADVFYFDFVKLRGSPAPREFQLLFFRRCCGWRRWSRCSSGLRRWCSGCFVLREIPFTFLLALLPFFIARGVIGTYEIRLFAEECAGRTQLAVMIFLFALLWLVWVNPDPASDLIEITAAMFTEIIVLMNLQHLQDRRQLPLPAVVPVRLGRCTSAGIRRATGRLRNAARLDNVSAEEVDAPTDAAEVQRQGHFAFASPTRIFYLRGPRAETPCTSNCSSSPAGR